MGHFKACVCYVFLMYGTWYLLGGLWAMSARYTKDGHPDLRIDIPKSVPEVRKLAFVTHETYFTWVPYLYAVSLYSSAYLYSQVFSRGGIVYLNLLSGYLFGSLPGTIICSLMTAIGSTGSYLIAKHVYGPVYTRVLSQRLLGWREKLQRFVETGQRKLRIGRMIAGLRIFPFFPNFLINTVSGQVGVPLWLHFLATFLGAIPYTFYNIVLGLQIDKFNTFPELVVGDFKIFKMAFELTFIAGVFVDPFTMIVEYYEARRAEEPEREHID